jgi:hypothetical protein
VDAVGDAEMERLEKNERMTRTKKKKKNDAAFRALGDLEVPPSQGVAQDLRDADDGV